MEYEWDPPKNEANLRKHGIDFRGALAIWEGFVVTILSPQWRHGELRWVAIGLHKGREIAVVYTRRGSTIRLISARRARRNERRHYWQVAGQNGLGAH